MGQSVEEVGQPGYVMAEDSLENTRAIHAKAETPMRSRKCFDGVAYGKGAIASAHARIVRRSTDISRQHQRIPNENMQTEMRRPKTSGLRLAKASNKPVKKNHV